MKSKSAKVTFISIRELRIIAEELYGADMLDEMGNFGCKDRGLIVLQAEDEAWDSSSLEDLYPSTKQILAHLRDLGRVQNGVFYICSNHEYETLVVG